MDQSKYPVDIAGQRSASDQLNNLIVVNYMANPTSYRLMNIAISCIFSRYIAILTSVAEAILRSNRKTAHWRVS